MTMWGFNLSVISVLLSVVDPILLTAVRIFISDGSVLTVCYFSGDFRLPTKREVLLIIYIAVFNVMTNHTLMTVA